FSLPMSSHGHSGAEPTKPPHSALTSENDNCNVRVWTQLARHSGAAAWRLNPESLGADPYRYRIPARARDARLAGMKINSLNRRVSN
ncbi:MAG: hypothetical protein ACREFL_07730, partial [Stellaceae bacterium]